MLKILKISENKYNRIFVISDIHAHGNLLEKMIEKLALEEDDLLLVLGDSCDRGHELLKTYDILFEIKRKFNLIHLKGNHEEMLYNYYNNGEEYPYFFRENGGKKSAEILENNEEYLNRILQFISDMPDIVISEHFIFVHAGLEIKKKLEEQNEEYIKWTADSFWIDNYRGDKTIIFGHKIQKNGNIRFYNEYNSIGIDCGSYIYNRIGCYEIKNKKQIYCEED